MLMADLRIADDGWRIQELRMTDGGFFLCDTLRKKFHLIKNSTTEAFAIRHSKIRHHSIDYLNFYRYQYQQ